MRAGPLREERTGQPVHVRRFRAADASYADGPTRQLAPRWLLRLVRDFGWWDSAVLGRASSSGGGGGGGQRAVGGGSAGGSGGHGGRGGRGDGSGYSHHSRGRVGTRSALVAIGKPVLQFACMTYLKHTPSWCVSACVRERARACSVALTAAAPPLVLPE